MSSSTTSSASTSSTTSSVNSPHSTHVHLLRTSSRSPSPVKFTPLPFSLPSLLAPLCDNPELPQSSLSSKTLIFLSLAFTSTASSLVLSVVATRLTHISLATFPGLEYLALSILARIALHLGLDSLLNPPRPPFSIDPGPLPPLTLRQTFRYALPTALCGLIASWSKAEVAGRVGIGIWQALEVFASPIVLIAISAHPSLQPSSYTFILASLLAFAVSLVLLCQPSPPTALFLGLLSPAAQAISLVSLKTWLLSFPDRGPVAALATSAPFALLAIAIPAAAHSAQRSVDGRGSLGVMPRFTVGTSSWLLIFVGLRAAERLFEALAVSRLRSPVAVTLLSPARNLLSLLLSPPMHIYVGLASGRAALVVVYLLTLLGLWALEPDVGAVVGLQSPSATRIFMLHDPDHPKQSLQEDDHEDVLLSSFWSRTLSLISFGPLAVLLLLRIMSSTESITELTSARVGAAAGRAPGSLDIVLSYYNEPHDSLGSVVEYVKSVLPIAIQHPRVVIYVKDPRANLAAIMSASGADEVVALPNVGREGGTYLSHILRHYNSSLPSAQVGSNLGTRRILASPEVWGLADHTIFMQPEVSWHWIAKPRMELYDSKRTGFLSFGPYLNSICGLDGLGNGNYERMRDIYVMFYETFCPPTGQLASYAGQFVVSRKRILRNSYSKYSNLKYLLEAPIEHWIHSEGGWFKWKGSTDSMKSQTKGPSSPFLGHALERSWPMIFGCVDPSLAEICTDDVIDIEKCQCFD